MPYGDPYPCGYPYYTPMWPPAADSSYGSPHTIQISPTVQETLGVDPISKLAAAIEKLAEALREGVRD